MSSPLSRFVTATLILFGGAAGVLAVPDLVPFVPEAPPLFSPTERDAILKNWNTPGRYEIATIPLPKSKGPFVVRLTPEASKWFFDYNRFLKTNAVTTTATNPQQPSPAQQWESWVAAKFALDQAIASQEVEVANSLWSKAQRLPIPPAAQPKDLPPHPGPVPPALQLSVGNPLPFASSVAPSTYTIRFESGETIIYKDNIARASRFPAYRFAQGVVHGGTPLAKMEPQELDRIFTTSGLTASESRVMRAVSRLEGGFEAVNTYDTGFVSVGFIQFAALENGAGSLARVLSSQKSTNPLDFQRDFRAYGLDVNEKGLLVVLDPSTGAELVGSAAVLKIIDDKRLTAPFQLAGQRSDAFRAAQIRVAKASYYPQALPIQLKIGNQTIQGQISDFIRSEAGLATLLDRKVNTGNLRPLPDVLSQLMKKYQLTQLQDLAPYEREIIRTLKWRHDFLQDATLTQPQ